MLIRTLLFAVLILPGATVLAQRLRHPALGRDTTPDAGSYARPGGGDPADREGQYASARVKIDAALAANAKNPQARFLRGVVQADQDQTDQAVATFQALTEDFPELPEPYNNLAVIWAQRGQYEKARTALESAIASHPDYAIAHENLGDIYSRLAGAEYDRAAALDKTNKSAGQACPGSPAIRDDALQECTEDGGAGADRRRRPIQRNSAMQDSRACLRPTSTAQPLPESSMLRRTLLLAAALAFGP
jgi:tetratricopeptide (TPR) repeat protein